ncbi:MAG: hypothetical protein U0103_13860 [Candidatus Obscuribacterales bacterium]
MGTNGDEFEKGDWWTFSRYLLPTRIPPGATTKNQIVTIEQSESLKSGMTLAAVRGLLGHLAICFLGTERQRRRRQDNRLAESGCSQIFAAILKMTDWSTNRRFC